MTHNTHTPSRPAAGFHHHHGGLFKPGGATRTSSSGSGGCELISLGNYNNGGGGMNLGGNECPSGRVLFGAQNSLNSSLTHVLDSLPRLKHDTGFAVEWSIDEQYKKKKVKLAVLQFPFSDSAVDSSSSSKLHTPDQIAAADYQAVADVAVDKFKKFISLLDRTPRTGHARFRRGLPSTPSQSLPPHVAAETEN